MLLRRFRPLLLRAWRLSLLVLAVVVIQKRQPSGMQSIAVERVRDFFPQRPRWRMRMAFRS
jgi:hypothetical protein